MTNGEKYKTAKERSEAFRRWCKSNYGADKCFSKVREHNCSRCGFDWLNLEAEEEKPLPCPFCGGYCIKENTGGKGYRVFCENESCGYVSAWKNTKEEAVAAHNRVAKVK